MTGSLAGLKVVEMAGLGPVPLAGQLLADHGAEVTLIDRVRSPGAQPAAADVNRRNKRSVGVNLKTPEGIELAMAMIARADILIEGFRPGVMERLGLGPDSCLTCQPRLIYGRMTGWGQDGPLAQRAGHDINYLSITGALHAMGKSDEPPMPPLNLVADYGGGALFLLFGVLAALHERTQSGRGQVIDAAMVDGVPAMMGFLHGLIAQGQWTTARESNLLDGGAPYYGCYETADGRYLSVGALEPAFFDELVSRVGLPVSDSALRRVPDQWPAMRERYRALFRSKTLNQWMDLLADSDACVAPVLSLDEVEAHPHNQHRKTFMRSDGVLQAAPAPRFSRTSAPAPVAPEAPGASTQNVLRTLGYSDAQQQRLRSNGTIE